MVVVTNYYPICPGDVRHDGLVFQHLFNPCTEQIVNVFVMTGTNDHNLNTVL